MSLIPSPRTSGRVPVLTLFFLLILSGAGFWWFSNTEQSVSASEIAYAYNAFEEAYVRYNTETQAQDQAAFRPGSASSPARQELNSILMQTLSPHTSSSTRLELASRGLVVLNTIDKEINLIGVRTPSVLATISEMVEHQMGFVPGSDLHSYAEDLIGYATSKQDLIETVVDTTTEMNLSAQIIFDRIIHDDGALTEAHILELNEQVDGTEILFDRLSRSYMQIQELNGRVISSHDLLVRHYSLSE
jgi:hypothetical protein